MSVLAVIACVRRKGRLQAVAYAERDARQIGDRIPEIPGGNDHLNLRQAIAGAVRSAAIHVRAEELFGVLAVAHEPAVQRCSWRRC